MPSEKPYRVYERPSVRLIARQSLNYDAIDEWAVERGISDGDGNDPGTAQPTPWWSTTEASDAEHLVELAGRKCYMSFGKEQGRHDNEAYIENIIGLNHTSVLEHAVFTFLVDGISRTLTHELVRHRAGWSYSQESQRYISEEHVGFVVPPMYQCEPGITLRETWNRAIHSAYINYIDLLYKNISMLARDMPDMGPRERRIMARESARSVLPQAASTGIVFTANVTSLRHFLLRRGHHTAEPEIRRLAIQIYDILMAESANFFSDFAIDESKNGTPCLKLVGK